MTYDIIVLENPRFRASTENDKPAFSILNNLHFGERFWKKAFPVTVNNVWTVSQSRRKNLHFQSKTETDRIGRYSYDDGHRSENITFRIFSNFVSFIPICWKYQMLVNFPVVDLLGTALKFRRERKICRDVFTSSIKRPVRRESRCCRAVTTKKCRRKRDACAKFLFCL